jgi:hypothetical protein
MILLISFLAPAVASISEDIDIVEEDISPQIIEPGKNLTVSISIWNRGGAVDDLSIELVEESPFILKSSSQNLEESFSLCAGCKITNTYYLTVDHRAVSGIYKLKFFVKQADSGIKREIDIDIKGKSDVIIAAADVPEDITPNSEFEVVLTVKNEGTGIARNIKLVSLSEDFLLKGTDILSVEEMAAGTSRQLNLTFLVGSSVAKGAYSLPIEIQYADHDGLDHTTTQSISARVVNKAKLSIKEVKIEPAKIKPGEDMTIQIRVENIGEGDADNIKLTLESELEGNKEAYMGRLEKDDDSPAFLSVNALTAGQKSETLTITYEDDLGQHTVKETINYLVTGTSSSTVIIFVLLGVIGALILLMVMTYVYKACKCAVKGKKCPSFKQHVEESVRLVQPGKKR